MPGVIGSEKRPTGLYARVLLSVRVSTKFNPALSTRMSCFLVQTRLQLDTIIHLFVTVSFISDDKELCADVKVEASGYHELAACTCF